MYYSIGIFLRAALFLIAGLLSTSLEAVLQTREEVVEYACSASESIQKAVDEILATSHDEQTFDNTFAPCYRLLIEVAYCEQALSDLGETDSLITQYLHEVLQENVFQNHRLYCCLADYRQRSNFTSATQDHLAQILLKQCADHLGYSYMDDEVLNEGGSFFEKHRFVYEESRIVLCRGESNGNDRERSDRNGYDSESRDSDSGCRGSYDLHVEKGPDRNTIGGGASWGNDRMQGYIDGQYSTGGGKSEGSVRGGIRGNFN